MESSSLHADRDSSQAENQSTSSSESSAMSHPIRYVFAPLFGEGQNQNISAEEAALRRKRRT